MKRLMKLVPVVVGAVMLQGCATNLSKPAGVPQASTVKFGTFANVELQPLEISPKFASHGANQKAAKKIDELIQTEKLSIVPLAYIRGRSLNNVIFIIDEAQNLTPHEIKTIITRAGENTKIIFTGDIFQIDTPYLDAQSNGLSYLVDRMNNNNVYAHVNLEKGERSELANLATKFL